MQTFAFRFLPVAGLTLIAGHSPALAAEQTANVFQYDRMSSVHTIEDGLPDSRALRRSRISFNPSGLAPSLFARSAFERAFPEYGETVVIAVGQPVRLTLFPNENSDLGIL